MPSGIDGQQQRKALSAAEQALRALLDGDPERATRAAARASELDQIDRYATFPDAVGVAAAEIAATGSVEGGTVDALLASVGPGPLQALVAELR